MREILFRGKRKDNGEWVEGFYHYHTDTYTPKNISYITTFKRLDNGEIILTGQYEVIPETVGQYTGLEDKNGKMIFEGDINKHRSNYSGNNVIAVVTYTDARFLSMVDCYAGFYLSDRIEVIGNIHDNLELLEVLEDDEKKKALELINVLKGGGEV